jgi:hypothetical protein
MTCLTLSRKYHLAMVYLKAGDPQHARLMMAEARTALPEAAAAVQLIESGEPTK